MIETYIRAGRDHVDHAKKQKGSSSHLQDNVDHAKKQDSSCHRQDKVDHAKKQGGLIKSSASRPTVNEPFKHSAYVRSYPDSRGAVVIKLKNRKSIFIDFFA